MYIMGKYWDGYIGGTDDSLTLLDYLTVKQKEEISLSEIFADTGLNKLCWKFRQTDRLLEYRDAEDREYVFYYAIDLITDLAALLLECKLCGQVNLREFCGDNFQGRVSNVRIIATEEEQKQMNAALMDFVSDPLAYDLSEMCSEEDMREMAKLCEELRKELKGDRL
ncbi:MAG: imm68 putative immunity domain-containing protein [Acetatifactor muris]|nr:imm68 putative immunity domain-containing protein [Acetatifactor muris]MCM1527985.1 imm68 putative immunity domain-containing protein [Bacteroides sp.]